MTVEAATTWTPAPERLGSAACSAAAVAARAWPMAMTSPSWRASLGSDSICARIADSSSVSSKNRLRAAQRRPIAAATSHATLCGVVRLSMKNRSFCLRYSSTQSMWARSLVKREPI